MNKIKIFAFILHFGVYFGACKDVTKNIVRQTSIDTISNNVLDTYIIKADTFHLKNAYTLIVSPVQEQHDTLLHFKLIGHGLDTVVYKGYINTKDNNSPFYYGEMDFENYFAIEERAGHSVDFRLFNKHTGEECQETIGGGGWFKIDFDLENELIIYENLGTVYVYDINLKTKTEVPSDFKIKNKCMWYADSWRSIYIKRVTQNFYYIGFRNCNDNIEYKLKKST